MSHVFADLQTGFSLWLFSLSKLCAESINPYYPNVSLVMDEMSLKQHLEYDRSFDSLWHEKWRTIKSDSCYYGKRLGKQMETNSIF